MRILISGGTGFVGRALVAHLIGRGRQVSVLSRSGRADYSPGSAPEMVIGDPGREGQWQTAASGADVVVNLAGASIFNRWTKTVKKELVNSRVNTTRNIVQAMIQGQKPGQILLSASAVGYYGFRDDEILDESATPGTDFLADLSAQWENEAKKAEKHGIRTALMRFGIVLETGGGALGKMMPLFRLGLGGRLGNGRQWFSWIHRTDLIRAVEFLIEHDQAQGPFNFTAPDPVTNAKLTKALGRVLNRPTILPAPGPAIKLAMGEFGSVLLKGQRVVPQKLLDLGFKFTFPTLNEALEDIVG